MPRTDDAFRNYLGSAAPSDLSDFQPLIKAYSDIYDHVSVWNNDTYPSSVSLASDVVAYSRQARIYYSPIIPLAEKLTNDPNDEKSKEKLQAILGVLINDADTYHKRAEEVLTKIKAFADETAQDKITLAGVDNKGGLYKYYEDKYGSTSEEVRSLTKEIEDQQRILDAANKEYEHDVVVAATTPSYAWVTIFGLIAAAVVAGIYGDKAVKALARAKAAQKKIDELQAELQVDANLMNSLNVTRNGLDKNIDLITEALPIIQKIQGVWATAAVQYESDYMILSTQEALTEQNINMAKTMVQNTQAEIEYVNALLKQAKENSDNASAAVNAAMKNFDTQNRIVKMVAIDFETVGIPEYKTKVILQGMFDIITSLATFGVSVGMMAVGNGAGAASAAESVKSVEKVAESGVETAKMAKSLAETMEKLKELIETLEKAIKLAQAIKAIVDNVKEAESQMSKIQELDDYYADVDLSAADDWTIYQIQASNAMKDPISLGIRYAQEYDEAMQILA
ncbi:hypothetical protein ANCCEY_15274, partial [Ancylostoma ceylanicum]